MRHIEKAYDSLKKEMNLNDRDVTALNYINTAVVGGLSPTVAFTLQSAPINEVGVNGCQAVDILEYVGHLFASLNESFPCEQGEDTIACIKEALMHQEIRTRDREERGVEGYSKK